MDMDIHGYIHVWIWDLGQAVDICMDITLAQHYSIKPMHNSSKLQTTYWLHIFNDNLF